MGRGNTPVGTRFQVPSQLHEKKLFKEEKLALAPCPPNFERGGGGGMIGRGLDRAGLGRFIKRNPWTIDTRLSVNIGAEDGIAAR